MPFRSAIPTAAQCCIRPQRVQTISPFVRNSTLTWFKGYKWYGDFVYRRASNGSITVINYVGVEDYVKGVLPYEIDPDWPAEAQKAQAVCARSFALGTHKHGSDYDLCNTTNCSGVSGRQPCNRGLGCRSERYQG